ncbi:asparagine synthetase B family protein [Exiguobacterium sp. 22311]|uniref:asparagine synthetase B family protein n=1 Tax=Exiguobacterium sp. 22311 TaxID=3453907 RepID=UPI003F836A4A
MSAIFGIFHFRNIDLINQIDKLNDSYSLRYQSDRCNRIQSGRCGLGAFEQWIRLSDQSTALPLQDGTLSIVADAMLDYREELAEQLGIAWDETKSDAEWILHAYQKWGRACVKRLYGPFSFAIYDASTEELFLARDPLGERSVCYGQNEEMFVFASTAKPVATLLECTYDEQYLEDYAMQPFVSKGARPYASPWEGVSYLGPGQTLIVRKGHYQLDTYWSYEMLSKETLSEKKDFYHEFEKKLATATEVCIAVEGEVGLQLSGGLDSTTVAAFAEPILKKRGQVLYGYTHVPLKTYEENGELGNERPLVEDLLKQYSGIQQTWVENPSRNSYNTMDEWLHILEMPYGFFINAPWLLEIHHLAKQQNIKVLLNGKHGNSTISNGSLDGYYYELLQKKQWRRLKRELGYTTVSPSFWKQMKTIIRLNLIPRMNESRLRCYYLKRAIQSFRPEFFKNKTYIHGNLPVRSATDQLAYIYRTNDLHERGVLGTLCSLHFRCITRDPTSDRKLIEFCAQLPMETFSSQGISKKIVRTIMKDRLPTSILNSKRARGKQSADWSLRIQQETEAIITEASHIFNVDALKMYRRDFFEASNVNMSIQDLWSIKLLLRAIALNRFKGGER